MKLFHYRHRLQGHHGTQPERVHQDCPASLVDINPGQTGIVDHMHGGREFVNRLAGMGFTIGAQLIVIRNPGHGPIVVSIRGANVALGRQEAARIQVMTE